jgi:hypothetical protein
MPYLFFVPLAWWAMHDETWPIALWLFAWGVLPTLVRLAYQNAIIKALVDTTFAFVQVLAGTNRELRHVLPFSLEARIVCAEITRLNQEQPNRTWRKHA